MWLCSSGTSVKFSALPNRRCSLCGICGYIRFRKYVPSRQRHLAEAVFGKWDNRPHLPKNHHHRVVAWNLHHRPRDRRRVVAYHPQHGSMFSSSWYDICLVRRHDGVEEPTPTVLENVLENVSGNAWENVLENAWENVLENAWENESFCAVA